MNKSFSFIRKSLNNFNFATFLLASLCALAALWLNSNYVLQEVYERDQEIILLKISSLEVETQALRFMALSNQKDIKELLPLVERMENLISNFITKDGKILLTENMRQMELDIAEIKKDITYMKYRLWPVENKP